MMSTKDYSPASQHTKCWTMHWRFTQILLFPLPAMVTCQLVFVKPSLTGNHLSVVTLDVSSCSFNINKIQQEAVFYGDWQKLSKHLKLIHTETIVHRRRTRMHQETSTFQKALKKMFKPTIFIFFPHFLFQYFYY